jgi:hypothetical protein
MIDGRTGNSPTSRTRLDPNAPVGRATILRPPASAGSSGSNTVRNSAVDRLTGDGMGGGFRPVGSSGSNGVVGGPSRKPMPGAGVITSRPVNNNTVNNPRPTGSNSGGSSGFNTSRPINNNTVNNPRPTGSNSGGSSGSYMINSQSGNAPTR